ncbi:radical SAM protein [Heliorestis acidaminivorans]|uniref:Radical SAM protein n=1 Tax=Heliorestis acidaminivorans TaxID=553427 RepID=A0A6I0ER20_9FIRM|nr:4Fe-4S single cluster domain-containing protein [Heliorestis acidaminivorans]KAB2952686.1 radical SAM protein [Heliorestis acidaminivorans]
MELQVHRFLPVTRAEGPGLRASIWVQGCKRHCPGCANPETWPFQGGQSWSVRDLATAIIANRQIEGVTFLGGEPFEQAESLAQLGQEVQEAGLSVLTFTGYSLEEIKASPRSGWQELLAVTDLLIDGPYLQEEGDTSRPWIGSRNQRYHLLTSRYSAKDCSIAQQPNRLEVRFQQDGRIAINGMADPEELEQLLALLKDRNDS